MAGLFYKQLLFLSRCSSQHALYPSLGAVEHPQSSPNTDTSIMKCIHKNDTTKHNSRSQSWLAHPLPAKGLLGISVWGGFGQGCEMQPHNQNCTLPMKVTVKGGKPCFHQGFFGSAKKLFRVDQVLKHCL